METNEKFSDRNSLLEFQVKKLASLGEQTKKGGWWSVLETISVVIVSIISIVALEIYSDDNRAFWGWAIVVVASIVLFSLYFIWRTRLDIQLSEEIHKYQQLDRLDSSRVLGEAPNSQYASLWDLRKSSDKNLIEVRDVLASFGGLGQLKPPQNGRVWGLVWVLVVFGVVWIVSGTYGLAQYLRTDEVSVGVISILAIIISLFFSFLSLRTVIKISRATLPVSESVLEPQIYPLPHDDRLDIRNPYARTSIAMLVIVFVFIFVNISKASLMAGAIFGLIIIVIFGIFLSLLYRSRIIPLVVTNSSEKKKLLKFMPNKYVSFVPGSNGFKLVGSSDEMKISKSDVKCVRALSQSPPLAPPAVAIIGHDDVLAIVQGNKIAKQVIAWRTNNK